MKISTQKIFFLISAIILATISLQVYWNYKNYISNTTSLSNEIQIAFDRTLETYFNEESKEEMISIVSTDENLKTKDFVSMIILDSEINFASETDKSNQTEKTENVKDGSNTFLQKSKKKSLFKVLKGKQAYDEIRNTKQLPNRFVISFSSDSIKYNIVDSIFKTELNRKKIHLNYGFKHMKNDSLINYFTKNKEDFHQKIVSKSSFFKPSETLVLHFNYSNLMLFQRMGNEIILSFVFLIAVISCLFFMLHIINKQKRIDEIKNDFINNITHEFKTPITTISTALEAMSNFNPLNDIEKNKKYISISVSQLSKLENMVEKILETATLNTDELKLNYEQLDLISFINIIVEKHQTITTKKISFLNDLNHLLFWADPFYLENVFLNLIDNSIKYGGEAITITTQITDNNILIDVTDNGNNIPKYEEKAIFDKFYRIPKGNIHDIKGYGIGLYFSKIILEKHYGSLTLINTNKTTFRITLPYEN
ncbi:ATP-binding protein [uncultured Flavobacterium sp.]|uniref:sensor histidine kinase n=1 Tax=uncultured Flavobacterium sp. TaxID=165435 RepID=UPI0030CA24C7